MSPRENNTKAITVCIIGSLRFFDRMRLISSLLVANGIAVFLPKPGKYRSTANPGEYASFYSRLPLEEKQKEDTRRVEAHLEKIRRTDVVYLVNPGGYVGDHTLGEIYEAHHDCKPIYALEPISRESVPAIASWVKEIVSPYELISLLAESCMSSATCISKYNDGLRIPFTLLSNNHWCKVQLRFEHMDDIYEKTLLNMTDDIKAELGNQTKIQFYALEPKDRFLFSTYIMNLQCLEEDTPTLLEKILPEWLKRFRKPVSVAIRKNGKAVQLLYEPEPLVGALKLNS
jgi:hypothetical protein